MNLLVSSLSFFPDHTGISVYATDFARYATERGHQVTVVTGFPFYPAWRKAKQDHGRLFRSEQIDGLRVLRGYIYVPQKVTAWRRIVHELSFLLFAAFNFVRGGRPDAIVVFTTPVLLGVLGTIFAKLYRCRLVVNVQDFQIEAARSLNMLKDSKVLRLLGWLERLSYRSADLVSSISPRMVKLLEEKGVCEQHRMEWPNWVDLRQYSQEVPPKAFRQRHQIGDNQKVLAYAGNIGEKQGLELLLQVAEHLRSNDDLLVLIVGAGAALPALEEQARVLNLPNVRFLPMLSPSEYRELLADVDAVFISQRRVEADIYFPSKLLGLMAAGTPLFVAADEQSELFRVVNNNGLGYAFDYDDKAGLTEAVTQWVHDQQRARCYAAKALDWVQQYDRRVVIDNVLGKLDNLVGIK